MIDIHIGNTDRVHPVDVGGDTSEDRGLPDRVASQTRHKAGNTVDVVFSIDKAVQRATGVTLIGTRLNRGSYILWA